MERPNNIDDLLRQRLHQAEVPPPAFVWPNVESALRRRKRRLLFWLLAIGTAASLAASWWWMLRLRDQPVLDQPVVAAAERPAAALQPAADIPSHPLPVEDIPETAAPEMPAAKRKTAPTVPASGRTVFKTAAATIERDGTKAEAQQVAEAHPAAEQTDQADTQAGLPALPNQGSNLESQVTALLPIAAGVLESPERESVVKPVVLAPVKIKKAPKKCYDFHTNRQAWLVDAYVGPSWANQRLHTSDSELDDYIFGRQRTEKPDWGFNAGVRASYLFAGNFLLRTGLHYDQYMEQFEHIDPNFIQYSITITQKLINGQWVSVTDTVGIRYGTDYLKTYNRFALLDIPLQAALELRSGPTGVSLNLGGSVNVLFHKRGSMLATNGKPASFTPSDGQYDVFRTHVGLSLMGSIQWFYHVTPRTRVFVEPYFRHVLEPVTRAGYPVEQSQGVGGVHVGATLIFD